MFGIVGEVAEEMLEKLEKVKKENEELKKEILILKNKIEFLKAQRNEIVYHYTNDYDELAKYSNEFNSYYGEV